MARKRASMREGPLAELFRATEAAQRQEGDEPADEPLPPAAEADEQQTLILDAPAAAEAAAPAPPEQRRREEAALEETVEHVHDFDARPRGAAGARPCGRRRGRPSRLRPCRLRQAEAPVAPPPAPVAAASGCQARAAVRAAGQPVRPADARGCPAAQRRW